MSQFLLQCITLDGIEISHTQQVQQLCDAGAKWIQLRMKEASAQEMETVASETKTLCDDHGALLIINDHLELALKVGAGGVHLGKDDMNWKAARNQAGPDFVIGGTVNSLADAREALASNSLDYVGVGPYRFTETKKNLAPILDEKGLGEIVDFLGDLPKVVIGGVSPNDLPAIAAMDADGVAVSSGLFNGRGLTENFKSYTESWPADD
ncbi:MAG: thiamine phosphate synthase [Verrucomicrobia bacterium]|nr:thiamine phosphate synthase [Verrucomicrobiota bacterium]